LYKDSNLFCILNYLEFIYIILLLSNNLGEDWLAIFLSYITLDNVKFCWRVVFSLW